ATRRRRTSCELVCRVSAVADGRHLRQPAHPRRDRRRPRHRHPRRDPAAGGDAVEVPGGVAGLPRRHRSAARGPDRRVAVHLLLRRHDRTDEAVAVRRRRAGARPRVRRVPRRDLPGRRLLRRRRPVRGRARARLHEPGPLALGRRPAGLARGHPRVHDVRDRPAEGLVDRLDDRRGRDGVRGRQLRAHVRGGHHGLHGRGRGVHPRERAGGSAVADGRRATQQDGGAMTFFSDAAEFLPALLSGPRGSLALTGLSPPFGLTVAPLLPFASRSSNGPLRWVSIACVEVGRGAPALVMLQFMYFGLPTAGLTLSALTSATLALTWTTAAYCAEYLRGGLSAVPRGEVEGSVALGMTRWDTLRYIVIPQGWRIALPSLMGFAVILFQMTSLAYTVAVPELMSQAYTNATMSFKYMTLFVLAGLIYASISIPATWLSVLVEKRMSRHL